MIPHQIQATLHISHHFDEYQHVNGSLHENYSEEKGNTHKSARMAALHVSDIWVNSIVVALIILTIVT